MLDIDRKACAGCVFRITSIAGGLKMKLIWPIDPLPALRLRDSAKAASQGLLLAERATSAAAKGERHKRNEHTND
jgi:hypothetical protein